MNYVKFIEMIRIKVETIMGARYEVKIHQVDKINYDQLQGIVIRDMNQDIAPTIYLENYFDEYKMGRSIVDIVNEIIMIYKNNKDINIAIDQINEYRKIKDKVFYKVINYKKNEKKLEKIPHYKMLDLAIIFCLLVNHDSNGIGCITINQELIDKWNVTSNDLYHDAQKNTPYLFPPKVKSMKEVIKSIILKELSEDENFEETDEILSMFMDTSEDENQMFVATNTDGINGAAWLCYENELESFGKLINSSFYILPSSIHEVILLPSQEKMEPQTLLEMVKDVNNTQVADNEILSNNIYRYEKDEGKLIALF